jgi:hypothetical protein
MIMPAALPQSPGRKNSLLAADQYPVNPSVGQAVLMDALSGTKGSPLDKDNAAATITLPDATQITWQANCTTGGLSTGIGYGLNVVVAPGNLFNATTGAPGGGFTDNVGEGASGANSTAIYIGGGRSVTTGAGVNPAGVAGTNPYTAGFFPVAAGNGGSRDAGAGPAFTGFTHKMVTATAGVANGAVVETGFVNRSGVALLAGESTFGSSTTAQAAAS